MGGEDGKIKAWNGTSGFLPCHLRKEFANGSYYSRGLLSNASRSVREFGSETVRAHRSVPIPYRLRL
jgi:hypothetical protein